MLEDLISTGGSAISVVEALLFIGADIQAVFSIFTYGFDISVQKFDKTGIPLFTLTDYTTLIDIAKDHNYVDEKDLETLSNWRESPSTWPG